MNNKKEIDFSGKNDEDTSMNETRSLIEEIIHHMNATLSDKSKKFKIIKSLEAFRKLDEESLKVEVWKN